MTQNVMNECHFESFLRVGISGGRGPFLVTHPVVRKKVEKRSKFDDEDRCVQFRVQVHVATSRLKVSLFAFGKDFDLPGLGFIINGPTIRVGSFL